MTSVSSVVAAALNTTQHNTTQHNQSVSQSVSQSLLHPYIHHHILSQYSYNNKQNGGV